MDRGIALMKRYQKDANTIAYVHCNAIVLIKREFSEDSKARIFEIIVNIDSEKPISKRAVELSEMDPSDFDEVKRRIMLGTYALSSGYYDAYYKKAQQLRRLVANDFEAVFKEVDVLLGPTCPTTAFDIGSKASDPLAMYLTDIGTICANLIGAPALSMPTGVDKDNMPIGAQLITNNLNEELLFRTAYNFEREAGLDIRANI